MKRYLLLSCFLFIALQSFSQVHIEKRRYQRGWYISLTDHKKKQHHVTETSVSPDDKKAMEQPVEAAASADTGMAMNKADVSPAATSPVSAQKKSSASFFAPPKIRLLPSLPAKKKIARRMFTLPHFHPAKQSRSLTGDNDMWGLLGQALLWVLIGLVVCALLFAIIDAVLVAAYGEAAAGVIELVACAAIMAVYYLAKGTIWLVQQIATHHEDKVYRKKQAY